MKIRKLLFLALITLIWPTGILHAVDLVLIRVNSEAQAEQARQILGQAYLRVDDRFLVEMTSDQHATLAASGIEVEQVAAGVDPGSMSLVFDNPGQVPTVDDLSAFGRTIALPDRTKLMSLTASAAASLQSATGIRTSPLSEWQTPIEYTPPRSYLKLTAPSYATDTLANLINQDTLRALDQRLEAFHTRYIWTDSIGRARDWIVQKFQSWGYSNVTTPSFSWGGGTHYNIQAIKTGYAEPNSYIVIGGHYDSYNQQSPGSAFAPGADDDGTGTALTMELARVFSKVPTRKSIIFIPFSAEEVGLVGSNVAATGFKAAGTNIECMYNFDMVGYDTSNVWAINLASGGNSAYREIAADAATRLTSIQPYTATPGSSSDHYSFMSKGYDIVDHIEHIFNTDGWHTNIDLTSRINFTYFTQVAKFAIASIAIAANAGKPGSVGTVADNGDGTSVTVNLAGCVPSSTYWVRYGISQTALNDSFPVPPGACSVSVTGLTEGIKYYFGVFEKPVDGYRSVWSTTASQTPLSVPRGPLGLDAMPEAAQIGLTWNANGELDIDHYNVYRRVQGMGDFERIAANLTQTNFTDTHVVRQIPYLYAVTAVDHDGNESVVSQETLSYAATFDGGVLVVDDYTQENYTQPTQEHEEAWLDTIFGGTPFSIARLDTTTDKLTRSKVGRFSTIFWDDDDIFAKYLKTNSEPVDWFLSHPTNMLICGYRTIDLNTTSPVPSNNLFRTQFGLSEFSPYIQPDFIGAKGQAGWPSVEIGPSRIMMSINYISRLTSLPGVQVIYRYDSEDDNPATEDQPVGLAWDSPNGKRILLAFPLYHLTPLSVKALVTKAMVYFGESSGGTPNGDIDISGAVDIADLTALIDYLYMSFTIPPNLNAADVDHSCYVDIADLTLLIQYLFLNGPAPLAGCVP